MKAKAMRLGTFVVAVALVLSVRDGFAQSSGTARRVFAGASVAWNVDDSAGSEATATGGALAIGVTAGFNFADRWSLQVEGEFPTSDQTVTNQYSYGDQSYSYVTRTTYRTPTVAFLFGVHLRPSERVDVAIQFGPGIRNEKRSYESQTLVNGAATGSYQGSWNDWLLRTSVGGEVAVRVTSRVAVVGQLRVHLNLFDSGELFSGAVARPAVGVRVRF
jgi:hypothetical protein